MLNCRIFYGGICFIFCVMKLKMRRHDSWVSMLDLSGEPGPGAAKEAAGAGDGSSLSAAPAAAAIPAH